MPSKNSNLPSSTSVGSNSKGKKIKNLSTVTRLTMSKSWIL